MTRAGAAVLALCVSTLAHADKLHLEGGGVIEAERWWVEGDTIRVESAGGTMGLPKSLVVRVERTASSAAPKKAPGPRPAAPAPAREDGAESVKLFHEGNAALRARDFETASRRFHEVVRREPDAVAPRVGFAVAEMALGRDAAALSVVLDGLTRHPEAPELHEVLGDLRNREERVDEALAAWQEAFRLAPTDRLRERIEKAERELAVGRDYRFSAAAHFNLRYDGDVDQDLAAAILDALEARYADLTSIYRHAPGQPITVLLYPRQAFRDVTQSGESVAGLFDGKIRVPLGGLKRLDPRAEEVLAHELTHAIVNSKTRGSCPRWLHEGLAQIAENRPSTRADAVRVARSVRADDPASWPDAAFGYPAALSLTRFLESQRGFDVIVAVLERLGAGESLDEALHAYYGRTYAELARAWAGGLREDGP